MSQKLGKHLGKLIVIGFGLGAGIELFMNATGFCTQHHGASLCNAICEHRLILFSIASEMLCFSSDKIVSRAEGKRRAEEKWDELEAAEAFRIEQQTAAPRHAQ